MYRVLALIISVFSWSYSFIISPDCRCGTLESYDFRIVGGAQAKPSSVPWFGLIMLNQDIQCGGSLITNKHVLTAGHCVNNVIRQPLSLQVGFVNAKSKTMVVNSKKIILHEMFEPGELRDKNDIAIIELEKELVFNENFWPVCLSDADDWIGHPNQMQVWGYGADKENRSVVGYLKKGMVNFADASECRKRRALKSLLLETNFCAYSPTADGCQGDSGGPIAALYDPGYYVQMGTVSWGIGCGRRDTPGIYVNISIFYDWINSKTGNAGTCSRHPSK